MRKLAILILTILVLCSCAESKKFRKQDGTVFEANPYGWANRNAQKVDGVVYDISDISPDDSNDAIRYDYLTLVKTTKGA